MSACPSCRYRIADSVATVGGSNGLWAWLELRAEQLLRLFWPAVEALADELLVRGEVAGTEARQIMAAAWASSCKAVARTLGNSEGRV